MVLVRMIAAGDGARAGDGAGARAGARAGGTWCADVVVGPWRASSRWRVLYVAATRVARLQAKIPRWQAELDELTPKYNELYAAQQETRKAQQVAEKAADAARAHLDELQRQSANEDSIKGAEEDYKWATTVLNRRQAVYRDITKTTEQVGAHISSIHESVSTINKTIHVIEANISGKEAAAAKGALLVLLLCLATALPHGS